MMRILRQLTPVQIMIDQTQPENLGSVITDDARYMLLLLLPLVLQPVVGFGLSNNVPPFCPIYH